MKLFLKQLLALFYSNIITWIRCPRHALVSIALSILFLLIADHIFVVWMGKNIAVGINVDNVRLTNRIAKEFHNVGLKPINYKNITNALLDINSGKIVAAVSVYTNNNQNINLIFSGKNPLLDRELSGILLTIAEKIFDSSNVQIKVNLINNLYSSENMSSFMAAGSLPFLLLILAAINCGLQWKNQWDKGILNSYLVTPVRRMALIIANLLSGISASFIILIISLIIGKFFVSWNLPQNIPAWLALILFQIVFASSLYLAVASLCRGPLLYNDISFMSTLILMFISGMLIPVITMPTWEKLLAYMLPTFYAVRSMRAIMTGNSALLLKDLLILFLWTGGSLIITYFSLKENT